MTMRIPLTNTFFSEGERVFSRPNAELNRSSLADLLNSLRFAFLSKGFHVDPDNSDAFPSAEEAYNQARSEIPENRTIIISFAPGRTYQLGFQLKKTHDVVFMGLDNGLSSGYMSTILEGDLDFEETPSLVSLPDRQLVVNGLGLGYDAIGSIFSLRDHWKIKIAECLMAYFKLDLYHGLAHSPEVDIQDCQSNANIKIRDANAAPSFASSVRVKNTSLLTSASDSDCDFKINKNQFRFENCSFPTFVPGDNLSAFDFLNSTGRAEFINCSFGYISLGDDFTMFRNAANAVVYFTGENLLYDLAPIPATWGFGIPVAKMLGMPFLKRQSAPTDTPPNGTRMIDVGASWKMLSWNGLAWV